MIKLKGQVFSTMRFIRFKATTLLLVFIVTLVGLLSFVQSVNAAEEDPDVEEKGSIFYLEPEISLLGVNAKFSSAIIDSAPDPDTVTYGNLTTFTAAASAGGNMGWQIDYVHLLLTAHIIQGKATSYDTGAGIGWEWNIPLMTTLEFIRMGSFKNSDYAPTGFKVGLSYFLSSKTKLNFSITNFSQTTSLTSGTLKATSTTSEQIFALGISFPIEIGYPTRWWREHTKK